MILIFTNTDIRLLQELKGRCSEYTQEALDAEFEHPTLYQQLRLGIGCEGSQRSHVILRAQPSFQGNQPWYDWVEVVVTEDRNGVPTKAHYAAQLLCFVDLTARKKISGAQRKDVAGGEERAGRRVTGGGDEEEDDGEEEDCSSDSSDLPEPAEEEESSWMLALVKFYISALLPSERDNDPNYKWKDLTNVHKVIRLPLVQEDPNVMARYGLIDTEQIQQGLWTQADFQTPDRVWVLKL